eukprot:CAMPEP_0184649742 /NCGR_PEP_ID=MMETSP0308-20130426/7153_1 /TAXON_ID=38269 /ORGANISM="Gloeochaete witrockiana, Strain SAG 46.84" /LENGTH=353 /DNA_ID=CAMNT_0027082695 /DNA_START=36 /DNA_END=1097 /DNA_ORIENTATION=+
MTPSKFNGRIAFEVLACIVCAITAFLVGRNYEKVVPDVCLCASHPNIDSLSSSKEAQKWEAPKEEEKWEAPKEERITKSDRDECPRPKIEPAKECPVCPVCPPQPEMKACPVCPSSENQIATLVDRRNQLLSANRELRQKYDGMYCRTKAARRNGGVTDTGTWCSKEGKSLEYVRSRRKKVFDKGFIQAFYNVILKKAGSKITVADFGGNIGLYTEWLIDHGVNATCYDGTQGIEELTRGFVRYVDLSEPIEDVPVYDWVFSLEVAEHVPKRFESILINNYLTHAKKGILITWAQPGQGGRGHYNPRPREYVVDLFASHGMEYQDDVSEAIRKACKVWWFGKNVMVFTKTIPR